MKRKPDLIQTLLILGLFFAVFSFVSRPIFWVGRTFQKNLQTHEIKPIRKLKGKDFAALPLLLAASIFFRQASKSYKPVRQAIWLLVAVAGAVGVMLACQGVHGSIIVWLLGALYLWHLFTPLSANSYYWAYPYRSGVLFLFLTNIMARQIGPVAVIVSALAYLMIYALRVVIWRNETKVS